MKMMCANIMQWIMKRFSIVLALYVHCSNACTELMVASKEMKPANALTNPIHRRHLPYLFARCTVTSLSESLEFSACFWRCQQEDTCVALHHEGYTCNICIQNDNNVNSLIASATSSVDVNMQKHYFVSMEHLNAINVEVLSDCDEVRNLIPGSNDGEFYLSLNGSTIFGTSIYCHGLITVDPAPYLSLPAGPDENFSFTTHSRSSQGRIKYRKLGLDLENMRINAWDDTFTIRNMLVDNGDPWINP